MSISTETSRLRVRIEIDALCTYKDRDYVEIDISWTDAVALRDRLDSLIHMMNEDCEGSGAWEAEDDRIERQGGMG